MLSWDAVTTRWPLGLKAALNNGPSCLFSGSPMGFPVAASHNRAVVARQPPWLGVSLQPWFVHKMSRTRLRRSPFTHRDQGVVLGVFVSRVVKRLTRRTSMGAKFRLHEPAGDLNGALHVAAIDEIVTVNNLLAFSERTLAGDDLAILPADGRRILKR